MDKQKDLKRSDGYTKKMLFFGFISLVSIGPSLMLPGHWAFIPPAILWLFALYESFKVDKIKKKYRLKTFGDIYAFGKKSEQKSEHYFPMLVIVLIFGAISGFIALISAFLFHLFLS